MSIISAIAGVIEAIVGAIVSILLAIWDFFVCIICCECFSGGSRRSTRSRGGGFGRRRGAATY
ncbi:hypothetical protein DICSQDRAFT_169574 [Dichomitus squalens LYAD-421 SS1]|nr:uncharacterized protein DICSQDRAFT_169574 [Dichomitus squalens LYAD-421 SS1]EJF61999.1 hypothetical protein DICSQDRAFT_169574 [Dichomitus squalens LYAD-421 SS1]